MGQTFLSGLILQIEELKEEIKKIAEKTSAAQLNWKPSPKKWSIGQVYDHLNTEFNLYDKQLIKINKKDNLPKRTDNWQQRTTISGKFLNRMINPASKKKVPAPGKFKPSQSEIESSIFEKQLANLDKLSTYIQKAENEAWDLNKIPVISPALFLLRMNLGECFQLEVFHNQRHLQQAKRVMKAEGFPKE